MADIEERAQGLRGFWDVATRWATEETSAGAVIRAAQEAQSTQPVGPQLALLASIEGGVVGAPTWFLTMLADTLAEVSLVLQPFELRELDEATEAAVRAMASRTLRGEFTLRQLTSWTHRFVTHEGVEAALRLVELADEYDLAEGGVYGDLDSVKAEILAEVRRLADADT